jgi:hypothetical protein
LTALAIMSTPRKSFSRAAPLNASCLADISFHSS